MQLIRSLISMNRFHPPRNENEAESQQSSQPMYLTFDEDDFRVNAYLQKEYDDYYDTTDQEDYDYLLTDDESLY